MVNNVPKDREQRMSEIKRLDISARMSQAVVYGDLIWLAGQCGDAGDYIEDQTKTALNKIDTLLSRSGSDKSRILSATIWLSNITYYDAVNAIWDQWMPDGCAPARACGETKLAGDGYKIEIICVAARSAVQETDG